ncbi:MAG: hypothetical protein ACLFRJ_08220, partial [Ectothiorhodospira sp.]
MNAPTHPTNPPRPTFTERVMAEGVRIHEDQTGRVLEDPDAWTAGRNAGRGLEGRIIARAGATRLGNEIR